MWFFFCINIFLREIILVCSNIIEKGMILFMKKAQDNVNLGLNSIKSALNNLEQAMMYCEKQENKNVIQSAINSINSACTQLYSFQD